MKKIRFAVVGYGARGKGMTRRVLFAFDEIEVTAVCDSYEDRTELAKNDVIEKYGKEPIASVNYQDVINSDNVDVVYVACAWESHVEVAIAAMKAGKGVALEVGGAYSLDELHELVKTYEETKVPFMFMENCCFNRDEILATAVVRSGKLGKIVHCSGAYAHDLRREIVEGNVKRHYRLRNYTLRNTENYPTHELGPIAKILNINRGNRMVSLVSMASKSCGLKDYLERNPQFAEDDATLKDREFAQGDVVTTIIKCEGGETILLKLDTTLPRAYSREFTVRGTRGAYFQDFDAFFMDGDKEEGFDPVKFVHDNVGNAKKFEAEHLHPLWRDITEEEKQAGHGGMDAIEFRTFIDCYLNGKEMPIDVYDAAAWMSISVLAEQSIAQGGLPQAIPDFTNGKWVMRPAKDVLEF